MTAKTDKRRMMKDFRRKSLALYIHWPFCVSKCPYCDFNSHVRETVDQTAWANALLTDLAYEASLTPDRTLGSIFFGGGTPSLMPPSTVAALIDSATAHWSTDETLEITLEANPSSVEAARFADLALAGVNRSSLGLQALDDSALKFLGRAHGVSEGLAALETAQSNFARVSFDLIYALPDQFADAWARELDDALGLGTEHLSLYQLTIEPGTRFATLVQKGEIKPQSAEAAADLFEATRATTAARGLPAYEVSNHARPGAESRHNLTYWQYRDYVGIGPGAHGRRGGMATVRHKKPENWMGAVARNGHGIQTESELSGSERAIEALLMGLRLRNGVDLPHIIASTGIADPVDMRAVHKLQGLGFLTLTDDRLAVTEPGMLLLDSILAEIVAT
jgi:putative oxygen-independent coproporphyrinogen III oxidase